MIEASHYSHVIKTLNFIYFPPTTEIHLENKCLCPGVYVCVCTFIKV